MSPADLAAYIGAAAWLPQIGAWAYRLLTKPVLRVMLARRAEIGFTSAGPIFNVGMSFGAERHDIVIENVQVRLTHEDGETHIFQWASLAETFSQIIDEVGRQHTVGREQAPIALKVGVSGLIEKQVRCIESRLQLEQTELVQAFAANASYLEQARPDAVVEESVSSREGFALLQARRNAFWWKTGRYTVEVSVGSPQQIKLASARWEFELADEQIRNLGQNVEKLSAELAETVAAKVQRRQITRQGWNWAFPELVRKQ